MLRITAKSASRCCREARSVDALSGQMRWALLKSGTVCYINRSLSFLIGETEVVTLHVEPVALWIGVSAEIHAK